MRTVLNCSKPRLSDEEIDPLEIDDIDSFTGMVDNGWSPWDLDDLIDIERIIKDRMSDKQKQVIDAFLSGMSYRDIGITEKHWRYHYDQAIEFIKEELKL